MNVVRSGRRRRKEKKGKRLFGAVMLALMAVLTVGTMAFATSMERANDSYSLVIEKLFANGTPNEAFDKEYTFNIEGEVRKDGVYKPYSNTITLSEDKDADTAKDGWQSEPLVFGEPYDLTVTEITDNIVIEVDGEHYNMSDSFVDSTIPVSSRKHEVELKNNSTLTISRPKLNDDSDTKRWYYHVTSKEEDEHHTSSFKALDMVFPLAAGGREEIAHLPTGETLYAGLYTIEQIAAPDGYQLQLGTREETIAAGKEGHFHINGTPGKLTLTAGGTKGDGVTRYYTIDRTETESGDTSVFVERTVNIASGESFVFDDLPKGGYTVTEYSFTDNADTKFSVMMPQTTEKARSAKSSAPQYTNSTNFRTFKLTEGTTYFKLDSFGPLYDANNKKIDDAGISYDFAYGWGNEKGGITYTSLGTYKANETRTMNATKRYPAPNTPKIGFRTQNVSDPSAQYLGVSWTEYFEKDVPKSFSEAGKRYTGIKVDDRGWLTITAPSAGSAEQIVYYFKIEDNKNNLVTGPDGATDRGDTTVKLKAGESITLNGLAAGSYKITEIIGWDNVGFTMKVEGYPFGTIEAGKETEVQVGGKRSLTITKPAPVALPDGSADERDYTFLVTGPNSFSETVTIKAGGKGTVDLLEHGRYKITPQKDLLGTYELNYKDSGAVYGTASGHTATVTFTNSFNKGDYGYRYVHEYYVKEPDGTYTYEGSSQITTRLGRSDPKEHYQAGDINKEPGFRGNQYFHFDEAYGWVDGISKTARALADPDDKDLEELDKKTSIGSSSDALKAPVDEEAGPLETMEPVEGPKPTGSDGPTEPSETTGSTEPEGPVDPIETTSPTEPAEPSETTGSTEPSEPTGSTEPSETTGSTEPSEPTGSTEPSEFTGSTEPSETTGSAEPTGPSETTGSAEPAKPSEPTGSSEAIEPQEPEELVKQEELAKVEGAGVSGWDQEVKVKTKESGMAAFADAFAVSKYCQAMDIGQAIQLLGSHYMHLSEVYEEIDGIPRASDGQAGMRDRGQADLGGGLSIDQDSGQTKDPIEESRPASESKPTEPTGPSGSADPTEPTDPSDPSDQEESAETPETTDPAESTEAPDTTDPAEPTEAPDTTDPAEPTEAPGITDPAEPTKIPEASDPTQETESTEPTDAPESTGPNKPAAPAESLKPTETQEIQDPFSNRDSAHPKEDPVGLIVDGAIRNKDMDSQRAFFAISYDTKGIISEGIGQDSEGKDLNYAPEDDMDQICVTEDASQIVILRYYRERQPKGKYNVIHVYYFRDENGNDHWEGVSGILPQDGELGVKYTGDKVEKVDRFQPEGAAQPYTYTYNNRPLYGIVENRDVSPGADGYAGKGKSYRPDNNWTSIEGTEEGDQIIILRYYRQLNDEEEAGHYHVVHEYYVREAGESISDETDSVTDDVADSWEEDTGSMEGDTEDEGDVSDRFAGTLDRNDGYVYTFVGRTDMEQVSAPLGSIHVSESVTKEPYYLDEAYQYIDAGYGIRDIAHDSYTCEPAMQWASSTEDGDEVIILRYYRGGSDPDEPDGPGSTPPGGGGKHHRDPGPDPTPPATTAPQETTEPTEENPGYPTELPDPNDPNSPDRITIWENGVPKTYVKVWNPETGTWQYILEEEVPLGWQDLPKTGDKSRNILWMTLFIGSIVGILWLIAARRKARS